MLVDDDESLEEDALSSPSLSKSHSTCLPSPLGSLARTQRGNSLVADEREKLSLLGLVAIGEPLKPPLLVLPKLSGKRGPSPLNSRAVMKGKQVC